MVNVKGPSQERQASQYLYLQSIGTQLSSHDFSNLEQRHHQNFAILFICYAIYDLSAKVMLFFQSAKFLPRYFSFLCQNE